MKVTYDESTDSAYLQLIDGTLGVDGVNATYSCDPSEVGGMINLDFDAQGVLVGIEVMDASRLFPEKLLRDASASDEDEEDVGRRRQGRLRRARRARRRLPQRRAL